MDELFSRQYPVLGKENQKKLKEATVVVIGCGGLGSTVSTVLSRTGVGRLILVDRDYVTLSNIHRQLLYSKDDIGKYKVDVAAANPLLCLSENIPLRLTVDTDVAISIINQYHPSVVMDCTDNYTVRYCVNEACVRCSVPFVFGSITANNGQVAVLCGDNTPCFACIHPEKLQEMQGPPPVIPGICTIIGSIQAQQAISIITSIGDVLMGELMTFDLFTLKMRRFKLRGKREDCAICGNKRLV